MKNDNDLLMDLKESFNMRFDKIEVHQEAVEAIEDLIFKLDKELENKSIR